MPIRITVMEHARNFCARITLAALALCCIAPGAAAAPVLLVNLGEIHGAALGWIRLAMPVFDQQLGGDIKAYAISVQEAGDVIHVVFHLTPVLRGQRGAAREGPGLEVELSKATGAVTGSRIIR
jgi:cytochrome c oxidase assembly factor CtaG